MTENTRAFRKTRIGQVVSDKMDKTIVVAIEDSVQHPAQLPLSPQLLRTRRHLGTGLKVGRELPNAEAGSMVAPSPLHPAAHDILKFSRIV